jgi:60 kDa SS-A/Ro ribonucleoprotein
VKGSLTWNPVSQVVDALDKAFYLCFGNVEPVGKPMELCLDVSDSMTWNDVAGMPGINPRVASAAMALITANVEPQARIMAFCDSLVPVDISPRQRLDDVIRTIKGLRMGATNCSLPMTDALRAQRKVDTFVVYTDNETYAGSIHPSQALEQYRREMGIPAKLVVVGMTANGFTIADPNDAGMLDVVGFNTATPSLISGFARR